MRRIIFRLILTILLLFICTPKSNAQIQASRTLFMSSNGLLTTPTFIESPTLSDISLPGLGQPNLIGQPYYYPQFPSFYQPTRTPSLNGAISESLSSPYQFLNGSFFQSKSIFPSLSDPALLQRSLPSTESSAGLPYRAASFNFNQPTIVNAFSPANIAGNYSPFAPFTPFFNSPQAQVFASLNGDLVSWPLPGLRTVNAVASLVLANAHYGMYCWDPVGWLDIGAQVGIWSRDLPVRAQSFDKRGFLIDAIPTFSVQPTGQTGTMTLLNPDILLYQGLINAAGPNDYFTTVTVDAVSTIAVTHRRSATCDACHPTPPGHIADPTTWGRCHDCHNLGNVMHVHAYNANIAIDDCYQCHPTGCLTGLHGDFLGMWCTNCHGTLADAPNGQMKISGQLGKPHCADCHDALHSENLPALFVDSAGHGGVWCINCHGPTHVENVQPFGYNNCQACHTIQAYLPSMGPDCGTCHGSSVSPHLVTN